MRLTHEEINPHNRVNEYQSANEYTPSQDRLQTKKIFTETEYTLTEEHPTQDLPPVRGDTATAAKAKKQTLLMRLLSTVAIACTTATAVLLPLTGAPSAIIDREEVSYNRYECVVSVKETSLNAVLRNREGETIVSSALDGKGEHTLTFSDLYPEESYLLSFVNKNGQERMTHIFETEPFLYCGEEENGQIPLTFHRELQSMVTNEESAFDTSLHITDSRGGDWGSNLMWDPFGTSVLYTDGLYRDTYTLEFLMHFPDREEPLIYRKLFDSGTLTPLVYDMTLSENPDTGLKTYIELLLRAGELFPYRHVEIVFEHTTDIYNYIWLDQEQIMMLDSGIFISLTDPLPAGEYRVTVWGSYTTDTEETRSNPIWQGYLNTDT